MAVKSRADILTEITTLLADNTNGDVSLGDFRTVLQDLADSMLNPTSDTQNNGLYAWDGTRQYKTNEIVWYSGVWYKANTNPGVTGVFDPAEWDVLDPQIFKATVTVPTADVLQLHSVPFEIVPAVTGKKINVLDAVCSIDFNLNEYVGGGNLILITETATMRQINFDGVLEAQGEIYLKGVHPGFSSYNPTSDTMLILNRPLVLTTATADPTNGDSDITITVYYTLI